MVIKTRTTKLPSSSVRAQRKLRTVTPPCASRTNCSNNNSKTCQNLLTTSPKACHHRHQQQQTASLATVKCLRHTAESKSFGGFRTRSAASGRHWWIRAKGGISAACSRWTRWLWTITAKAADGEQEMFHSLSRYWRTDPCCIIFLLLKVICKDWYIKN